jgi:hypothetical protein
VIRAQIGAAGTRVASCVLRSCAAEAGRGSKAEVLRERLVWAREWANVEARAEEVEGWREAARRAACWRAVVDVLLLLVLAVAWMALAMEVLLFAVVRRATEPLMESYWTSRTAMEQKRMKAMPPARLRWIICGSEGARSGAGEPGTSMAAARMKEKGLETPVAVLVFWPLSSLNQCGCQLGFAPAVRSPTTEGNCGHWKGVDVSLAFLSLHSCEMGRHVAWIPYVDAE